MLEILNKLKPFFEDNYRRIHVREYAKLQKISPPTSSTVLSKYQKEGLLKKELDRNYQFYFANKESKLFQDLQCSYYAQKLENSGLIDYLERNLISPIIILFGSLTKSEVGPQSDIDLAIFTISKKEIKLDQFNEKLERPIQLFIFKNKEELQKNPELLNNILNGFKIKGSW
jgi:predicted nucleotidyltransferase